VEVPTQIPIILSIEDVMPHGLNSQGGDVVDVE